MRFMASVVTVHNRLQEKIVILPFYHYGCGTIEVFHSLHEGHLPFHGSSRTSRRGDVCHCLIACRKTCTQPKHVLACDSLGTCPQ